MLEGELRLEFALPTADLPRTESFFAENVRYYHELRLEVVFHLPDWLKSMRLA